MSVEVNDFRKYVENKKAQMAAEEAAQAKPLLPQSAAPEANTGNDQLDKCVRVFQSKIEALEIEIPVVAEQGMGAFQTDLRNLAQLKWMFLKGKLEGYKEAKEVPAQVIVESRG